MCLVLAPLAPVMVTVDVLAAVPLCTKKLTETVPLALTDDGLKLMLTPGKKLALSETVPVETAEIADGHLTSSGGARG
jgi:hypothetical protein